MPPTIVHLSAEYYPFARTGGLAEAVNGLANVQARQGNPVVVFLPLYRSVREQAPDLAPLGLTYSVHLGPSVEEVRYFRAVKQDAGPRVVFIEHPHFFNRSGIYGESGRDYADNAERYAFFCLAVLEAIPRLIQGEVIVHAHDWHTAPVFGYARAYGIHRERYARVPMVMSVHNGGYQGHFPADAVPRLGIPPELYTFRHAEWYGRLNFLKMGLTSADCAATVSPNHARELRTPGGGFGLQDVYQWMGSRFTGITNGIDQRIWDPATDPHIAATYTRDTLHEKVRDKTALQRTFGLPQRKKAPVFGMAARLVTQKGIDIILRSHRVQALDAQFVFLGSGEPQYEEALSRLSSRRPHNVAVQLAFTDLLEHKLVAGADMLLMPSQYEPCGLTQMRAQRYGTLPIARRVGGLADTVSDDVTGFLFDDYHAAALDWAIDRALKRYADADGWARRMRAAMSRDFAWERSAEKYAALYRRATEIASRR
ncbi:MAG: glycogen synthase [Gemmatimonadetes bacterium]|nr:glycogen synthase [Gemmatimonadota bacterium]